MAALEGAGRGPGLVVAERLKFGAADHSSRRAESLQHVEGQVRSPRWMEVLTMATPKTATATQSCAD